MSRSTEEAQAEAQVRAALYALGVLRPEEMEKMQEMQEFQESEEQLADRSVDETLTTEVKAFETVVTDLGYAAPPQSPPKALRGRVLNRIVEKEKLATAEQMSSIIEKPGLLFTRSEFIDWKGDNTSVQVKTLSKDPETGYRLSLIRMAPGAVLPPHRHADVEDSYVLEGEMLVSGVLMRPGDHCRAEPDSVHTGVISRTGCVFIARASLHDEF